MQDILFSLEKQLRDASENFYGYPCNLNFDYSEILPFLKYALNNIGEPFSESNHRIHTRKLEAEVIQTYSSWVKAPANDVWGYVTNGGTEGNMYGLYLARELYPNGIVYYSEATHYSVQKIIRFLNVRSIMIRANMKGEIDLEDFEETVRVHRDCPAIIFTNFGTTMMGAIDDVHALSKILEKYKIDNHYIHADGALSGMILPFINNSKGFEFTSGIDSLSVSGHKFIGSPIPCGIVLAKKKHVDMISRDIEYIGASDNTIMGSRNGFTPLLLWYAFQKIGFNGFKENVKDCLNLADYTIDKFTEYGIEAWRNPYSITVVFRRPSEDIIKFFQLAPEKNIAHLITMPHLNKSKIDFIIGKIAQDFKKTAQRIAL